MLYAWLLRVTSVPQRRGAQQHHAIFSRATHAACGVPAGLWHAPDGKELLHVPPTLQAAEYCCRPRRLILSVVLSEVPT